MLLPGPSQPGHVNPYPNPPSNDPAFNEGTNSWPGWDIMVLHDLGAPTSKYNIYFLDWWQEFEHSKAKNNPLNLTGPSGTGSINSAGVQNYGTRQQGAKYTANNIKAYPTIYKMLMSDNVKGTLLGSTDIIHGHLSPLQHLVTDLRKWGSNSFADKLSGGTSSIDQGTETAQNVYGSITGIFSWIGGNWERIFYVIGGTILVLVAIIFLAKSQSGNALKTMEGTN